MRREYLIAILIPVTRTYRNMLGMWSVRHEQTYSIAGFNSVLYRQSAKREEYSLAQGKVGGRRGMIPGRHRYLHKYRTSVDGCKHDTRDDSPLCVPYFFSSPATLLKNTSVTKACIYLPHILTISLSLVFRYLSFVVVPVVTSSCTQKYFIIFYNFLFNDLNRENA